MSLITNVGTLQQRAELLTGCFGRIMGGFSFYD